jgi:hypothetical protein
MHGQLPDIVNGDPVAAVPLVSPTVPDLPGAGSWQIPSRRLRSPLSRFPLTAGQTTSSPSQLPFNTPQPSELRAAPAIQDAPLLGQGVALVWKAPRTLEEPRRNAVPRIDVVRGLTRGQVCAIRQRRSQLGHPALLTPVPFAPHLEVLRQRLCIGKVAFEDGFCSLCNSLGVVPSSATPVLISPEPLCWFMVLPTR